MKRLPLLFAALLVAALAGMWERRGPWWRVWPDVSAHKLTWLPSWVQRLACRWRGPHRYRYTI